MKTSNSFGITGRDPEMIAKALAYAISIIDTLPFWRQEGSDRDDMQDILIAMVPNPQYRERMILSVRRHLALEPFRAQYQDGK